MSVWGEILLVVADMKKKTVNITLCGITSALIMSIMLASYFPFLTISIPAVAGVIIIMPLIEAGKLYAFATYIVTAVLSILFAEKEAAFLYVFLFGYYPILKAVIEKIGILVLEYLLKFVVFNGSVSVVYLFLAGIFGIDLEGFGDFGKYSVAIFYVVGNVVFYVYDMCIARLGAVYMYRLHPKVKKILKF